MKRFIQSAFLALFVAGILSFSFSEKALAQETEVVTLIKFSDYQCPACKYFIPIENQLKEEYGDKLRFVHKNFPLSIHEHAQLAARTAEAAKVQGKFDEMYALIFEGQEQWSRGNAEAIFLGYAKEIGLDFEQFEKDMKSAEMQRIVMADRRQGRSAGVNSTPTYFINGKKLEGNPRTYEGFKALIDAELK